MKYVLVYLVLFLALLTFCAQPSIIGSPPAKSPSPFEPTRLVRPPISGLRMNPGLPRSRKTSFSETHQQPIKRLDIFGRYGVYLYRIIQHDYSAIIYMVTHMTDMVVDSGIDAELVKFPRHSPKVLGLSFFKPSMCLAPMPQIPPFGNRANIYERHDLSTFYIST